MEIVDLKKAYKSPQAKVLEVKVQKVLCSSPSGENTEKFGMGSNSYGENDWS